MFCGYKLSTHVFLYNCSLTKSKKYENVSISIVLFYCVFDTLNACGGQPTLGGQPTGRPTGTGPAAWSDPWRRGRRRDPGRGSASTGPFVAFDLGLEVVAQLLVAGPLDELLAWGGRYLERSEPVGRNLNLQNKLLFESKTKVTFEKY